MDDVSYRQIVSDLQAGIEDGTFPPGTPLPRATDLCAKYKVSPPVVTSAFNTLARKDLITGARGGGRRIVLDPPKPRPESAPEPEPEPEPEPVATEPVAWPALSGQDDPVMVTIEVSPTVAALVQMMAQVEGRPECDVVRLAVEALLEYKKHAPEFQLRLRGLIEGLQRFRLPGVEFPLSPPNP